MIAIRFVLLGICVWLATSMASGRGATNPIARVLRTTGWCLIAIGVLGCFIGMWSPMGLMLSLPLGAMFLFAIVNYGRRRCEALQDTLLGLITLATGRGIPLGGLADAFARDAPTWAVLPATSFAHKLNKGLDLADAAWGTVMLLPPRAMMAIRVGQQLDELAPCLDLYTETNRNTRIVDRNLAGSFSYILIVLFTAASAGLVMSFHAWRIMPEFIKIYSDFSLQLPLPTQAYLVTLNFADSVYVPILGGFGLLGSFLLFVWFLYLVGALGWVRFTPLAPLFTGRDVALSLRFLGLAIERNRSTENVLFALADTHSRTFLRDRFRRSALDIRLGLESWPTLAKHRLIRTADVPFLQAAERVGNLPWALTELAGRYERRTGRRVALLLRAVTIACFVLVAALVVFYAVACFVPIVTLIEAIT